MRSLELFAGAGGLALGVSKAGFKHAAVIEYDADTCITLRENKARREEPIAHWTIVESDVRKFDYSTVSGKIDLLAGGPPCQPFSIGGKHRAYEDSRDMFPEAVRAVRELKPRAFMFENVKGLTRATFDRYFTYIKLQMNYPEVVKKDGESWMEHLAALERIKTSGDHAGLQYNVVTRIMNAADFGVPQRRHRVFFVGFRNDLHIEWSFPMRTHSQASLEYAKWVTGEYWDRHEIARKYRPAMPSKIEGRVEKLRAVPPTENAWRTVRDALRGLPDPTESAERGLLNHFYVPGAKVYVGHTGSPIDEPAKTLKAGDHGVPGGENMMLREDGSVRYFTIRESARLQTFPDTYYFPVSWTESMRQLGNAVPVELSYVVAKSIAEKLR